MLLRVTLSLLILLQATFVFAQSSTIDTLGGNSNDDKAYICNVGVRQTNGLTTNGDLVSRSTAQSVGDYITIVYNNLSSTSTNNTNLPLPNQYYTFEVGGTSSTHTSAFVDDGRTSFQKRITSLFLNFTSERYGAEFFVDMCYIGPKYNYNGNNKAANFRITNWKVDFVDQSSAGFKDYAASAGLQVSVYFHCDTQRSGSQTGQSISFSNIPDVFTENDSSYTSGWTSLTGSSGSMNFAPSSISIMGPAGNKDAPRACLITYAFRETTNTERKWRNRTVSFVLNTLVDNLLSDNVDDPCQGSGNGNCGNGGGSG